MARGPALSEQDQKVIRDLSETIAKLTGEVAALTTLKDRTADLNRVTEQVEQAKLDLKRVKEEHAIEVARIKEANEREKREVTHDVGLLRKQLAQDEANQARAGELAQQAAVLKVREENLGAERAAFAEQMQFQRQQMMNEMTGARRSPAS